MDEQKQKEFNVELQALLIKYNITLQPTLGINIVPRETTSPTTGTEETN